MPEEMNDVAQSQPEVTLDEQIAHLQGFIDRHPISIASGLFAADAAILASLIRLREIEGKLREPSAWRWRYSDGDERDTAWRYTDGADCPTCRTECDAESLYAIDQALLLRAKP